MRIRDFSALTFDCYGTLTRFRMKELTVDLFADREPAAWRYTTTTPAEGSKAANNLDPALADRRIEEAMREGKFDNLAGMGWERPLLGVEHLGVEL